MAKLKWKQKLINMVKRGVAKPSYGTKGYYALRDLVGLHSPSRDVEFVRFLRKQRPSWLLWRRNRPGDNKCRLMTLALKGKPRPKNGTTLGYAVKNYTMPKSDAYDSYFAKALMSLRPDWFRVYDQTLIRPFLSYIVKGKRKKCHC